MSEKTCPTCQSVVRPETICQTCGEDVFEIIPGKVAVRAELLEEYHRSKDRASQCSVAQQTLAMSIRRICRTQKELRREWRKGKK